MDGFDVADLSRAIARVVAGEGGGEVAQEAVSVRLQEVLFGSRGLWHAYKSDLVTREEAAEAATAHLETWLEEIGALADERSRYRKEAFTLIWEALS